MYPVEGLQVTCRLSVMKSALGGLGCFASIFFSQNTLIGEYAGERITHAEAMRRMTGANGKHISQLDKDHYIDGCIGGNETQYINHSCEPNADVLIVDRFMIVFALREILPGEEITVDYLNSFDQDKALCQCYTASCRRIANQRAA